MDFDGIITCGDSYTLGPVYRGELYTDFDVDFAGDGSTLIREPDNAWPVFLAKELNVPYINLSRGGASNTEISLQPLQTTIKFKKPLMIFGFTIDIRYPFFGKDGRITSQSIEDNDFNLADSLKENQVTLAKDFMQRFLLPTKMNGYTGMDNLFVESVKRAMNYEKLNTNATVIWGDIHSHDVWIEHRSPGIKKHFSNKTKSRCFNNINNGFPLQQLTTTPDHSLQINYHDSHPNKDGCKLYAETIQKFIASIS
jgi:hypothetical protein